MRNPFRFNFDKEVWMFGTNEFTDFIGGMFTIIFGIVTLPYYYIKKRKEE